MDKTRHARLKAAFSAVCDAPAEDRARALDEACAGDASLRAEVESLLAHESRPAVDLEEASRSLLAMALSGDGAATRPARLGAYEVLETLGEGGMGVVYRARQESPQREVALKVLRARFVTESMLRRFEREAEALGRLHHAGIAQIFEAGIAENAGRGATPFFAMEYIRGEPIVDYASRRSLSARARVELFLQVCEAVEHAHREGVIHRDLKPANILVEESSGRARPKVLDFGVASVSQGETNAETLVTRTGEVVGTLSYMSPEQFSGDAPRHDGRVDVYALGATLYELLTGQLPRDLRGKSVGEAIRVIETTDARRLGACDPSLRGDLETIVATALENNPARRYASPGDLARDLRRFLDDHPIAAHPPSTMYQVRKFARRNRALVAGASAVVLALVVGIVATSLQARVARQQRFRAEAEAAASREVSGFLHTVLTSVDPIQAGHRDVTVRDALDQAVERLGEMAASGAEVRASLARTIGLAYRSLGEHAIAERHLRSAWTLRTNSLGPDHPETFSAQSDLTLALVDLKRLEEAKALAGEGRLRAERALGRETEEFLRLTAAMAIALYWSDEYDASEALEREVVSLHITLHGESDRRTLIAMSNLGLTLADLGKFDEAEEMLQRCIALRESMLGADHLETIYARSNLAKLRMNQGRLEEARVLTEENLERSRQTLGESHPQWQAWVRNVAVLCLSDGRFEEAAAILEEAEAHLSFAGAESDPGVVHHLGLFATVLLELGDLERARTYVDRTYDLSVAVFGQGHIETQRAASLYYDYFERIGDAAQQAAWGARLVGTPFDPTPADQ